MDSVDVLVVGAVPAGQQFQADASGAAVTGDPLALAGALRTIDHAARRLPLPAQLPAGTPVRLTVGRRRPA